MQGGTHFTLCISTVIQNIAGRDGPCLLLLLTTFLNIRILNETIVIMHQKCKQISA